MLLWWSCRNGELSEYNTKRNPKTCFSSASSKYPGSRPHLNSAALKTLSLMHVHASPFFNFATGGFAVFTISAGRIALDNYHKAHISLSRLRVTKAQGHWGDFPTRIRQISHFIVTLVAIFIALIHLPPTRPVRRADRDDGGFSQGFRAAETRVSRQLCRALKTTSRNDREIARQRCRMMLIGSYANACGKSSRKFWPVYKERITHYHIPKPVRNCPRGQSEPVRHL
jgi:hypothetical protein